MGLVEKGFFDTAIFGCGEKGKKEPDGCKTERISVSNENNDGSHVTCYCTGSGCFNGQIDIPREKNSANTIGTRVTIGLAFFLVLFSKIMA